jgi:hypothetical protein
MRVRFLADENFNKKIISGLILREPLVDFLKASEAGLTGEADLEVLRAAAALGRVLVTHDRQTMPNEFGVFLQQQHSSGVLVVPQSLPVRIAIEELLLIWAASGADEWADSIWPVPI